MYICIYTHICLCIPVSSCQYYYYYYYYYHYYYTICIGQSLQPPTLQPFQLTQTRTACFKHTVYLLFTDLSLSLSLPTYIIATLG